MKLRTQFTWASWISAVAVVTVVLTIFDSDRRMSRAIDESDVVGSLNTTAISGLRTVTIEYMLNPGERARQQWWQRYASLESQLSREVFDDPDEIAIVASLRSRNRYLAEIFPKLAGVYAAREAAGADKGQLLEVERRLATQILIATDDMVSDTARLLALGHAKLEKNQQRANTVIGAAVASLGLLVAAMLVLGVRGIVTPIRRLEQVAQIIGRGNFEHRTRISVDSEIGDLSRAIDEMTERLAASDVALRQRSAQLEDANRELESFSYSVSHDLRAPLRGIDGWSAALADDLGERLDDTTRKHLAFIRAEAQRMGHLIDDLLALSRVSQHEFRRERVDLSAIAQTVAQRLATAHPGRRIEFTVQPGLAAQGDARMLEIALTNLLDNACKFSGPRDTAVIEVGETECEVPGTGARSKAFFVRDNGVGFDMTHADKLFGAFQRLHRASEFPGTGIGLATVQRIIHRHGGRIWADAQLDRGATFHFTLREAK